MGRKTLTQQNTSNRFVSERTTIVYLSVSLKIGPHFESWDPFTYNPLLCSKGNSKNVGVLCPKYFLKTLTTCGSNCIREESCDLHMAIKLSMKLTNRNSQNSMNGMHELKVFHPNISKDLQWGCEEWYPSLVAWYDLASHTPRPELDPRYKQPEWEIINPS